MLITYKTKNYKETQKLGEKFAKEILSLPSQKTAIVLALQGNLGGGKTTFLQGLAKGLGIKEKILSPTFVILKHFVIPAKAGIQIPFKNYYHIDCYRLKNYEDILELNFKEIISNPKNIVAIEWPEKIKRALPKNVIQIEFACPESSRRVNENYREIKYKM